MAHGSARPFVVAVLGFVVALLGALTPAAQNKALIIGNDDYQPGNGWTDLPGVVPDTNAMNAALTAAGWMTKVIRNQTAAQITAEVTANIPPAGKKYLVYYAGHGNNAPGDMGELAGVDDSMVTPAALVAALGAAGARTLLILDSCGGGEFADQVNGMNAAIGTLTSTTDLECANKTPAGGFFTQCFVMGLNGAADSNGDMQVTVAEAAAYALANCVRVDQHPTWDGDQGACVLSTYVSVPALPVWGVAALVLLALGAGSLVVSRGRLA